MPQAQGVNARLAYQIETSYGLLPASLDLKKLYYKSGAPQQTRNLFTSQVLSGSRNPKKAGRGRVSVSASIPTELSPQIGTMLKAALGTSTPTGGPAYTHTIKIGALPSLLMELGFTDLTQYLVYLGMKVNKLTFPKITDEGIIGLNIDLLGQCEVEILAYDAQSGAFTVGLTVTGAGGSTGLILSDCDLGTTGFLALYNCTGNFVNDEAITDTGTGAATANLTLGQSPLDASVTDPGHTPFDGASIISVKEGGSTIANVNSIDNLAIENGLDTSDKTYVIGGGGRRKSLPEGITKVSGTLNALFEDMTLYRKAVRYTESSLEIIFRHGTGAGSAGNEQLKATIPELVYAPNTPAVEGPSGILVSLPFEAYYDNDSAASAMWLELKNAEATI